MRYIRDAWRAYSRRAAAYQAELILSLVYFLILGPTAVVAKVTRRKSFFGPTGWRARSEGPRTLDELTRQF